MPSWPDDYFLAIPVLTDKLYMNKNIVGIVAPIPSHPWSYVQSNRKQYLLFEGCHEIISFS